MAIIKQPPAIHTAFNPAMLHIQTKEDVETVDIEIVVNNTTVKKSRESLNKIALFNLSEVVNRFFNNSTTPILEDWLYVESRLFLEYLVKAENETLNFSVVNAVAQIGESSDMTKKIGHFLTDFERLKRYEGYELAVSVIGYNDNTVVKFDKQEKGEAMFNHATIKISDEVYNLSIATGGTFAPLESSQLEVITNSQGETIYIRQIDGPFEERFIYIDKCCMPQNPFYVRWINQHGGHDYWMFSFRQYITKNVENPVTFKPTIFDQETELEHCRVLDIEATSKITVGASNISADEYEAVSKIIFSPFIEWYNEKLQKWLPITIDDGESTNDTRDNLKQIELIFNLPDIQKQF